MNDADRRAPSPNPISSAPLEILLALRRLEAGQIVQAAQIDQLSKVLPAMARTLEEMTQLLLTVSRNMPPSPSVVSPPQKPAPQDRGAVVSLVPKAEA